MASNYPGSLDSFDTIASDKKTSDAVGGRTHRDMHNDLGDAIEAVQTELGTDPAGGSATVKARFDVIEANDWVTAARIAANAVGSSELADNAVDTAAIADAAVTAAKILIGAATVGSGTGTPEGVVTAAPGSSWLQIGDAVTVSGNLLWRKTTGTGNTGWEPEGALADTGWRNVAASIDADWEPSSGGGSLMLRRVGKNVYLTGDLDRVTGSGSRANTDTVYTAPTGFRPTTGYLYVPLGTAYSGSVSANGLVNNLNPIQQGDIAVTFLSGGTYGASENVSFTSGWITSDAWPSSLPGAAA